MLLATYWNFPKLTDLNRLNALYLEYILNYIFYNYLIHLIFYPIIKIDANHFYVSSIDQQFVFVLECKNVSYKLRLPQNSTPLPHQ